MVQQKTGAWIKVRCTPELKAKLDALPPGEPDDFLVEQERTGKPYSKDFFSREVRRTAVHALADAGRTVPQIVAVTGHTLESATKILKRYYFPDQEIAEAASSS